MVFGRGKIAVGMGYGCVVTRGATLTCWGRSFPDKPTLVAGVANVASVAAAQATTCAMTTTGAVYCMEGSAPKLVDGLDDAVELATDSEAFTMCARRKTGHVACWTDFDKGPVKEVDGISGALEIAVAGGTPCIRDAKGVACVVGAKLARIPNTETATHIAGGHFTFAALRRDQPPLAWHEDGKPQLLPALNADIQQIALGSDTACALGHAVQCWDLTNVGKPYDIPAVGASEIAVGYSLRCARFADHVGCWGSTGVLGDGPGFSDEPTLVANLTDATQIEIDQNRERACALRANKQVWCWGTTTNTDTDPVPVEEPHNKDSFVTPREWTGSHQRGQWTCKDKKGHIGCKMSFQERGGEGVSTGDETSWGALDGARDLRMPTNELEDVCVASALGEVSCFPAFGGADGAAPVAGLSDVIQLVGYGEKTCALERAGTVKCWKDPATVTPIANITDAVQLVAGDVFACIRHKTGTVSCWGHRAMLGDGRDSHQRVPLTISGVSL